MTAEVVVLNKSAVALAADSKVTIGGSRMAKTYDTVNKLFTLSKVHPVGVMIYGSADFMRYPWETIIKLYRQQKGAQSEPTVSDWAEDFQRYIETFGKISQKDRVDNVEDVVRSYFAAILDEADDCAISRGISIGSDDYIKLLKSLFTEKIADISQKDRWLNSRQARAFIKQFGSVVDGIRAEFLDEFADTDLSQIGDLFISAAIFSEHSSPMASGVVIAGFGDDEYFPTVISLECDGYVGSQLKIYRESEMEVTRSMTGGMRAFAQGEMVQRFMSGFDPNLGSALMTAYAEVLLSSCMDVLDAYGMKSKKTAKTKADVEKAVRTAMTALVEQFGKYTTRAFSHPIVEMISLLPKDEMANLAESLVALTSLKRRVSSDLETVGGAIDVALISKTDGFVWIKRKYYFPEDINPQFSRNYMNGINIGENDARTNPPSLRRRTARKGGSSSTEKANGTDSSVSS